MDAITFRFLISLVVLETLDTRLMDVVASYLYESFHMKIPEGFTMPEAFYNEPISVYSIKLQKSS